MIGLLTFFGSLSGRLVLVAALVAALVALRAADIQKQRGIGAERAVATIEKANDKATDLGKRAGWTVSRSRGGHC